MARATFGTPVVITGTATPYAGDVTLAGTGVLGMAVAVIQRRGASETLNAPTWNGQTGVLWSTDYLAATQFRANLYRFHDMAATTASLSFTAGANRNVVAVAIPLSDLHATAGTAFGTVQEEADLSATVAGVTGDQTLLSCAFGYDGSSAAIVYSSDGTGQTELTDTRVTDVSLSTATQEQTGSVTATFTASGGTLDGSAIFGALVGGVAGGASAAVTGTLATGTKTQADIVAGALTIILTLTGDTFVASGATFDAIRDDIIAGLDAASSPSTGWNTLVRDTLAVTTVVRTSDTIVTITLPAIPTYAITADEVITCTIPAAALTGAVEVVASPTITIHEGAVLSAYSGTTNGSGVLTTDLTSDIAGVRVLTRAYVGGTEVGRTTTLPG